MLIDDVQIKIKAGDGGDGKVHFFTNRWTPKGGPDGGDGGRGGTIFFKAVADISKLRQFRFPKVFKAENGVNGGSDKCSGKSGADLILEVPVGTVATYDNGSSIELTDLNRLVMMARGGRGGRGNFHYRSSINQSPKEFQPGMKVFEKHLRLQLKLIAQVGLIGLPNAGKTSLLNQLTSAGAPVANYAFTTLEPNLGVMRNGYIIADIPGLIEGASEGKGLGFKFLRHVERTGLLVHCIAADSQDPVAEYNTVRKELENYSSILINKPEIVVLTKSDNVDKKTAQKIAKKLNAVAIVSIIDDESLSSLSNVILDHLKI